MSFSEFLDSIVIRSCESEKAEQRMAAAREIAAHYNFKPAEAVLLFTSPELANLPVAERCKHAHMTEEELLICMQQQGFRNFLADVKTMTITTVQLQAALKLGQAVATSRFTYDKNGNATEDFHLETQVLLPTFQPPAQQINVNLQMNQLWDEARAKAERQLRSLEAAKQPMLSDNRDNAIPVPSSNVNEHEIADGH